MGKTWKDKPRNVEDVPIYKRRKKSPKPQPEDAEAEMLIRLYGDGGYVVAED